VIRGVRLYPGEPHAHDAEIERLFKQLKKLVLERRRDRCRENCPRDGHRHTAEAKAKIGAANKGNSGCKGLKRTKAYKKRVSEGLKTSWARRRALALTNAWSQVSAGAD
jgi:hypothetical protein